MQIRPTLTLYCQGKPFLVDSGRYTYREDDPLRTQLKALPPTMSALSTVSPAARQMAPGIIRIMREIIPHYFAEQGNAHLRR